VLQHIPLRTFGQFVYVVFLIDEGNQQNETKRRQKSQTKRENQRSNRSNIKLRKLLIFRALTHNFPNIDNVVQRNHCALTEPRN